MSSYEQQELLERTFNEEQLSVENVFVCEEDGFYVAKIDIEGDWKHDHLRLKYVMETMGWVQTAVFFTDESDCDWYSAQRHYKKPIQ